MINYDYCSGQIISINVDASGGEGQQIRTSADKGEESKIGQNLRTSFMDASLKTEL